MKLRMCVCTIHKIMTPSAGGKRFPDVLRARASVRLANPF